MLKKQSDKKQYSRGFVWVLIALAIMVVILIIGAVTGAAIWGDRTGIGGGAGGKTNPDGTPIANEPIIPVDGACPNVSVIPQLKSGWCGRASQAMVVAYFTKNTAQPQDQLSAGYINSKTGKSYHFTSSAQDAANSVKSGNPVIAYSTVYKRPGHKGNHIFVLTCFDESTQTFTANDPEPGVYRGGNGHQGVTSINNVPLTIDNLTGPYSGVSFYSHPNFLVTN